MSQHRDIGGGTSLAYQSEAQLEKNMIAQLVRQGYEQVTINNYDSLVQNFRES